MKTQKLILIVAMTLWRLAASFSPAADTLSTRSDGWRDKLVFWDDRYDEPWANPRAAAEFLAPRGFRVVDADELGRWVTDVTERKKAADTVVVLPHGLSPMRLLDIDEDTRVHRGAPGAKLLVRRYMETGGRVVWSGELPF
ncbi:MAG: hypothetical protein HY360_25030 [Verrucomicrobia bacterium]|nr:hypothetical protein [Verrucomicrobiota bacterium]